MPPSSSATDGDFRESSSSDRKRREEYIKDEGTGKTVRVVSPMTKAFQSTIRKPWQLSFWWMLKRIIVLTFGFVVLTLPATKGERVTQGCYDAAPISCEDNKDENLYKTGHWRLAEDVCRRLAFEVFPARDVFWDVSLHPAYLNAIDASDELCSEIQQMYSQCMFCYDEGYQQICAAYDDFTSCGGMPTEEEIIHDTEIYEPWNSLMNISQSCEDIQSLKNQTDSFAERRMAVMALSYPACTRQTLIQHLCPGSCPGGCFNENPLTCTTNIGDPPPFPYHINQSDPYELEPFEVDTLCWVITNDAFRFAKPEVIMDVSSHFDFLQIFPGYEDQCDWYKWAYPQCVWCNQTGLCFNDEHPASCDAPADHNDTALEVVNDYDEWICDEIFLSFVGLAQEDLMNTSKHAGHISLREDDAQCAPARAAYHTCVWCPQNNYGMDMEFCLQDDFCNTDVVIPEGLIAELLDDPNVSGPFKDVLAEPDPNSTMCEALHSSWFVDRASPKYCLAILQVSRRCPSLYVCEEADAAEERSYLGATTKKQKRALIWTSRVSALLSFLGASYILCRCLFDTQARATVYHQLMIGMASFDIVTALAWGLATAPIHSGASVEGARGNDATCKAQAFFLQLGFGSIFYNVSLAIYYFLVISNGWREFQLKKIRTYLHGFPIIVGLGLALGGIPIYDHIGYACHVVPKTDGTLWEVLVFVVLPLGMSIVAITVCMLMVYASVRKRAAAGRKWSFGVGKASKMEQAVFFQCLFYMLAFYVSWPILFSVYLFSIDENGPFGLSLTVAFLAPLQGFNNFLVFIRPKLLSYRQHLKKSKAKRPSFTDLLKNVLFPFFGDSTSRDRSMDPSVAVASVTIPREAVEEYKLRASALPALSVVDECSRGSRRALSGEEGLMQDADTDRWDDEVVPDELCRDIQPTVNACGGIVELHQLDHKEGDGGYHSVNSFRNPQDDASGGVQETNTAIVKESNCLESSPTKPDQFTCKVLYYEASPRPRRDYRQYLLPSTR